MTDVQRLADIRASMAQNGVDVFLVPRADEFQGEYVPACAERLAWVSGFTGSAGIAAVGKDRAVVVTDSRYDIQVREQVDASLFDTTIMPSGRGMGWTLAQWIMETVPSGSVVGYDPKLHTPAQLISLMEELEDNHVTFRAVAENPLDAVWHNRPGVPMEPVTIFPLDVAGRTAAEKRHEIARVVREEKLSAVVLTKPDSIAWLLNIRGNDVPHTPLALSYATVHADGRVDWFIHPEKVSDPTLRAHLGNHVRIVPPADIEAEMKTLAMQSKDTGSVIGLDFARASLWFRLVLEGAGGMVRDVTDPCVAPRAAKNKAEQKGIINAHIRDGVAVTRFLAWATRELLQGTYSELDVAEVLENFRRAFPEYRDSSFDTIAGWNANGAIVHYRAMPDNFKQITPPGMLLLDSGAQYCDGTTDITRTIAVGAPTDEMRENYTRVLRGHIAVSMARIDKTTTGVDVDALAREPLRDVGLDYGHGTGHGVGCYLSVHEDGAGISPLRKAGFAPGMLISNEPGYYKAGEYGIRIENLVLTRRKLLGGMFFETVTLVPYDRNLICADMLRDDERAWLNAYHERVEQVIGPHLDDADCLWLGTACAPI